MSLLATSFILLTLASGSSDVAVAIHHDDMQNNSVDPTNPYDSVLCTETKDAINNSTSWNDEINLLARFYNKHCHAHKNNSTSTRSSPFMNDTIPYINSSCSVNNAWPLLPEKIIYCYDTTLNDCIPSLQDTDPYLRFILRLSISSRIPLICNHSKEISDLAQDQNVQYLQLEGFLTKETFSCLFSLEWPFLKYLKLHGIRTSTLNVSVISKAPSLLMLDLSNNILFSETNEYAKLPRLRFLNLSFNYFKKIPSFFKNISLYTLDLSHNVLESFNGEEFSFSQLRMLYLSNNTIDTLNHTFGNMPNLISLQINNNLIRKVEETFFSPMSNLRQFVMNSNNDHWITAVGRTDADESRKFPRHDDCPSTCESVDDSTDPFFSEKVFGNLVSLCRLELSNMGLKVIPANLFQNLTSLRNLELAGNQLEFIPKGTFDHLSNLSMLALDRNSISCLPSGLFSKLSNLVQLGLSRNRLTCLPTGLFPAKTIERLGIADNRLSTLPIDTEDAFYNLKFLQLDSNRFKTFSWSLPNIQEFHISTKTLKQLPAIEKFPLLETFSCGGHTIQKIIFNVFKATPNLKQLDISRCESCDGDSILILDSNYYVPNLSSFDMRFLRVPSIEESTSNILSMGNFNLNEFYFGSESFDDSTFPMEAICKNLMPYVNELAIIRSAYVKITLCPDYEFKTVFLPRNFHLKTVESQVALRHLDVSDCQQLKNFRVPAADTLDISGTSIPPDPNFCRTLGSRLLFARNLKSREFRSNKVAGMTARCLIHADLLDLSRNSWLDDSRMFQRLLRWPIFLADGMFHASDLSERVITRTVPAVFNLEQVPVSCGMDLVTTRLVSQEDAIRNPAQLAISYDCSCETRFRVRNGKCVPKGLSPEAIAGIATAGIFFGLLLVLIQCVYQRYRRYKAERYRWTIKDELNQHLIQEKTIEVQELKRAWEIDFNDLQLLCRIDKSSPGTYGEVWKARWESLVVAVKVLKKGLREMDEVTVQEFEKEVAFLQKTRHAHVVRFFGAGRDTNDCPFLVLELVTLGSLRGLLSRRLEHVLFEYEKIVSKSSPELGEQGLVVETTVMDDGNVLELIQNRTDSVVERSSSQVNRPTFQTVWELKVSLARDIARGMEYIHSLDMAHRLVFCILLNTKLGMN